MPIYEYRCPNGHTFEVFHGMQDPPPEGCEVCGATGLEKVLHPVPIIFRGKGFYSTDYGRGGRRRETKDSEPVKAGDSKKSEKADTKKAEPAS